MVGCPCGVMVKAMDCGIVVSEFKIQLLYYIHFQTNNLGKGMNLLILPAMGEIVPLFIWKDCFGTKYPTRVDMPLNKETKPIYIFKENFKLLICSKYDVYIYIYIYINLVSGISLLTEQHHLRVSVHLCAVGSSLLLL